jgi:hypothetical protein
LTTHLVRRGSLTITYPEDANPTKETFGVGSRIDVPAGKVHEVWMGDEGESLFMFRVLESAGWCFGAGRKQQYDLGWKEAYRVFAIGCEYVIGE